MVSKSNLSSPRKCEFFFIKIVRTLIVIIIILTEDNFSLRGYHNKSQIFFYGSAYNLLLLQFFFVTCYQQTWYDQIHVIKQSQSLYSQGVSNIRVGLWTTNVIDYISLCWKRDEFPFAVADKLCRVCKECLWYHVHTKTIVRPGTEFQITSLLVDKS